MIKVPYRTVNNVTRVDAAQLARDVARHIFREYEFIHTLYGLNEPKGYAAAYQYTSTPSGFTVYVKFFDRYMSLNINLTGNLFAGPSNLLYVNLDRSAFIQACKSQEDFITGRHLGLSVNRDATSFVGHVSLGATI